MPRRLRIEYRGAFHHVTSRGYARQTLFYEEEDFSRFLSDLNLVYEAYSLPIHSYCLMTNHVHLFTESPLANLQYAMQRLFTRYADYYKRKYNYKNKVFERRYGAVLVDSENYAIDLQKYIHLNPVGPLVKKAEDWNYSSYKYLVGNLQAPKFLQKDLILGRFDTDLNKAKLKLRCFTEKEESSIWLPENFTLGKSILGSVDFFKRIEKNIEDKTHADYLSLVHFKEEERICEIFNFIKSLEVDDNLKESFLIYALKTKTSLKNSDIAKKIPSLLKAVSVSSRFYCLRERAISENIVKKVLCDIDLL